MVSVPEKTSAMIEEKRHLNNTTMHELRHTQATQLLANGVETKVFNQAVSRNIRRFP